MLPRLVLRIRRRGQYRDRFGERFGLFSKEARARLEKGGWIWIHAVSVGEMMMALKLVRAIRAEQPQARVLLSTTTSTGMAVAVKALAGETEEVQAHQALIYYPVDFAPIVRRVLALVRPAQLVLVDKELWPNMIAECYRRGVPVSIVNARLSARSGRRFLKWRRWVGPFFTMLEQVCLQEPQDRPVWRQLGVKEEALHWTGSLKFDSSSAFNGEESPRVALFRGLLRGMGEQWAAPSRFVMLGGSTFPGEEAMLTRVYLKLRARYPQLRLVLAPRHVERTAEVERELHSLGVRWARRRQLEGDGAAADDANGSDGADLLLIDTTGELADWYYLADACVIGKSFRLSPTGEGGQNPVEAIEAGCPVLCGPAMGNFAALMAALEGVDGVRVVADEAELLAQWEALLKAPQTGKSLVERARSVLAPHQGATERIARRILC